ncbi:hypothetical protein GBA65_07255 [Rubrobacter marinus]|uniref:Uncharacterized protein n=1 Tax=Rubrobacter marinus TaxID=2653852 RepID=A0A6G8PVW9_9ACTN|nr:hypothetical protein [Rubrobacter marinus]QIN78350.1 hypothetical protein GBA65_07255 [Rubrobacter marinus]
MGETVVVFLSLVLFSIASALAAMCLLFRRRERPHGQTSGLSRRVRERVRLRIAASLLDLGNHLMLCDEERRARQLRRRLSGRRARRLGLEAVALRLGARRADEVTLELTVGGRRQEDNPSRMLVLSCVVHHPVRAEHSAVEGLPQAGDCTWYWRVANRPSPGYRGPSTTCEVPSLERALVAYHARPFLPSGQGGRFLDEGFHDNATRPGATKDPNASA